MVHTKNMDESLFVSLVLFFKNCRCALVQGTLVIGHRFSYVFVSFFIVNISLYYCVLEVFYSICSRVRQRYFMLYIPVKSSHFKKRSIMFRHPPKAN